MFSRPILVTAFNRPDFLEKTLAALTNFECTLVYISIDGARHATEGDSLLVEKCRELAYNFNAGHPERVRFSEKNLGCGLSMSSAIQWFFETEEAGIILEDDIGFDIGFLNTMDYCLHKFEYRVDIGSISGLNPLTDNQLLKLGISKDEFLLHSFF